MTTLNSEASVAKKTKIEKRVANAIARVSDEQKIGLLQAALRAAGGHMVTEVTHRYSPRVSGDDDTVTWTEVDRYERQRYISPNSKVLELLVCNFFPDLVRTQQLERDSRMAGTADKSSPQAIRDFAAKLLQHAKEIEQARPVIEARIIEETSDEVNRKTSAGSAVDDSSAIDGNGSTDARYMPEAGGKDGYAGGGFG